MTTASYPAERLDRDRAALILVDHQVGLVLGVEDPERELLRRNVVALTKVAKAYGLPVVITTSADSGPNGILLPEISAELLDARSSAVPVRSTRSTTGTSPPPCGPPAATS